MSIPVFLQGAMESPWRAGVSLALLIASFSAQAVWDVTRTPPTLVNPITILLPDETKRTTQSKYADYVCAGEYYAHEDLAAGQDYIVRMAPAAQPLSIPITLRGGRNVRVVGLAMDLVVQPGCGIGLHSQPGNPGSDFNVHPLLPNSRAVFLSQSHTSFIEGAHIKMNGIEADVFIGRNFPNETDHEAGFATRDYIFQNSRLEGWEGTLDYLHGDLFQQQNSNTRNLYWENVTYLPAYGGMTQEANSPNYTYGLKKWAMRNVNMFFDPVHGYGDAEDAATASNNPGAIIGIEGALEGSLANVSLENYYIQHYSGLPADSVFFVSWWPGDPWYRYYDVGTINGEPRFGIPPGGDYALANQVGLNYVSPHDAIPMALTAHYKLDETSGTTAADSSGNGRNGTVAGGAVWTPGQVGSSLVFDGVDDVVTTGLPLSTFITATSGTMACWMKPTGSPATAAEAYLLPAVIGDGSGNNGIVRGTIGGLDRIWAYSWDANEDRVGVTYTVNEWVHIAWKRDATTLYIYKNGVEAGTIAAGASTPSANLQLGKSASGGPVYAGAADDCRFFNTALTAAEIRALFDEVRSIELFPPRPPIMRMR